MAQFDAGTWLFSTITLNPVFLKGLVFSSTWVAEARKNKEFKGKLYVLCGFSSGERRSYSAFDLGDLTKKSVVSSPGFLTDFIRV